MSATNPRKPQTAADHATLLATYTQRLDKASEIAAAESQVRARIGPQLLAARLAAGLTRRQTAERMGACNMDKTCSRLAQWERGETLPVQSQVEMLAVALPDGATALRADVAWVATLQKQAATAQQSAEEAYFAWLGDACQRLQAGDSNAVRELGRVSFSCGVTIMGGVSFDAQALQNLWSARLFCFPCSCGGTVYLTYFACSFGSGWSRARGFCPGHHGLQSMQGPSSPLRIARPVMEAVRKRLV